MLKNAAMNDETVILTTLNEAWAAPNSIIELFLESFRTGEGTRKLLNHLVIVALDEKAFSRCLVLHAHCYALVTEGVDFSQEAYFMTPDYLKMMWRRIDFLRSVLEMGYNFVFTVCSLSYSLFLYYLQCKYIYLHPRNKLLLIFIKDLLVSRVPVPVFVESNPFGMVFEIAKEKNGSL